MIAQLLEQFNYFQKALHGRYPQAIGEKEDELYSAQKHNISTFAPF
ncbi:hypothetical protein SAMN05421827_1388 [Pedobacter terrae]|uniref:Uncharacterized protein n=1 Tax=Pedobacter terrae TaxID=405671 RepID=A0A1G8EGP6_9SPHI|nr:hypothetical protein [Pedobacter terrae]SDH68986.1 hypothetical protein SAMN05421827_1388 [Pedobacter terrae]